MSTRIRNLRSWGIGAAVTVWAAAALSQRNLVTAPLRTLYGIACATPAAVLDITAPFTVLW